MSPKHAAALKHFSTYDSVVMSFDENAPGWCGAIENCDVCSRPMGEEIYMIDGPCQAGMDPMWGNLCIVCAHKSSPKIGWGMAQLYKRQGERWYLVAGGPPSGGNDLSDF
ncbi:hypothetical protein ACM9W9_09855 [Xanthomonas sacchari]